MHYTLPGPGWVRIRTRTKLIKRTPDFLRATQTTPTQQPLGSWLASSLRFAHDHALLTHVVSVTGATLATYRSNPNATYTYTDGGHTPGCAGSGVYHATLDDLSGKRHKEPNPSKRTPACRSYTFEGIQNAQRAEHSA